jgi:hypothetical protein
MRKQCQSRKENSDPADDTDKDLSDVPSDFNQSKGTTRLRERIVERWDRSVESIVHVHYLEHVANLRIGTAK